MYKDGKAIFTLVGLMYSVNYEYARLNFNGINLKKSGKTERVRYGFIVFPVSVLRLPQWQ